MPRKKVEKKKTHEAKADMKGVRFYKHKFVNCSLTINPEEVATGKSSVRIMLQKDKQQDWGSFSTDDESKQKLIASHPLFGRQIFEITAEEAQKISAMQKPEQYHRGVAGALMGKGKR